MYITRLRAAASRQLIVMTLVSRHIGAANNQSTRVQVKTVPAKRVQVKTNFLIN